MTKGNLRKMNKNQKKSKKTVYKKLDLVDPHYNGVEPSSSNGIIDLTPIDQTTYSTKSSNNGQSDSSVSDSYETISQGGTSEIQQDILDTLDVAIDFCDQQRAKIKSRRILYQARWNKQRNDKLKTESSHGTELVCNYMYPFLEHSSETVTDYAKCVLLGGTYRNTAAVVECIQAKLLLGYYESAFDDAYTAYDNSKLVIYLVKMVHALLYSNGQVEFALLLKTLQLLDVDIHNVYKLDKKVFLNSILTTINNSLDVNKIMTQQADDMISMIVFKLKELFDTLEKEDEVVVQTPDLTNTTPIEDHEVAKIPVIGDVITTPPKPENIVNGVRQFTSDEVEEYLRLRQQIEDETKTEEDVITPDDVDSNLIVENSDVTTSSNDNTILQSICDDIPLNQIQTVDNDINLNHIEPYESEDDSCSAMCSEDEEEQEIIEQQMAPVPQIKKVEVRKSETKCYQMGQFNKYYLRNMEDKSNIVLRSILPKLQDFNGRTFENIVSECKIEPKFVIVPKMVHLTIDYKDLQKILLTYQRDVCFVDRENGITTLFASFRKGELIMFVKNNNVYYIQFLDLKDVTALLPYEQYATKPIEMDKLNHNALPLNNMTIKIFRYAKHEIYSSDLILADTSLKAPISTIVNDKRSKEKFENRDKYQMIGPTIKLEADLTSYFISKIGTSNPVKIIHLKENKYQSINVYTFDSYDIAVFTHGCDPFLNGYLIIHNDVQSCVLRAIMAHNFMLPQTHLTTMMPSIFKLISMVDHVANKFYELNFNFEFLSDSIHKLAIPRSYNNGVQCYKQFSENLRCGYIEDVMQISNTTLITTPCCQLVDRNSSLISQHRCFAQLKRPIILTPYAPLLTELNANNFICECGGIVDCYIRKYDCEFCE